MAEHKDDPLDVRTRDKPRVPPGQVKTEKWPVLHYGDVPQVDIARWRFEISGLVEQPVSLTYDELTALPRRRTLCDIHCVTRWSRLDNEFEGISVQDLLRRARPRPEARYVLVHAEQGFTTNLPLTDLDRPDTLLAWRHNGADLTPDHGWPLRLVVPHLYFWKSAKWVHGLELLKQDMPGFWEQNGYHMRGDPWEQERYGGMSIDQWMINRFRNQSKK
ncbi:MAG TPA: sulfite oxidase-like oxidoreductase [Solirubrobacteraceae bacterium]|nr:sulfite oxidase-like oxidoreductase [Solirubrobacteraceae bacterium]